MTASTSAAQRIPPGAPGRHVGARARHVVARAGALALPWTLATLSAAVAAALVQTQLNLYHLAELGAPLPLDVVLRTNFHDLRSFMPFLAVLVACGYLAALPVASALARRWPRARTSLLALAGAAGTAAAFLVADRVSPVTTLIAATRWAPGHLAMIAAGAFGGLVYARLSRAPFLRRGWPALLVPVALLPSLWAVHLDARPSREDAIPAGDLGGYRIEIVAAGLAHPWGIAFLPDGRILITERPGRLRIVDADGALRRAPVVGVPPVLAGGQGGLMDVRASPHFARDSLVFLTYACGTEGENNTCLARGRLVDGALRDTRRIFAGRPLKRGTAQYGSRIAFLADGTLVMTVGDGFDYREWAQRLDNHLGKVLRLHPDGTVPRDNPFAGRPGARPEIYAYGVRNPQGIALDPESGRLYTSEHGPRGGDEVNLIEPGANYGWPLTTHGINYPGDLVSPYTRLPEARPPLHQWTPSIAPSGIAIYRGALFPELDGDLLVSALAGRSVHRLDMDEGRVKAEEQLFGSLGKRIRLAAVGPEGAIYLLTDHDPGRVLRVVPAGARRPDAPGGHRERRAEAGLGMVPRGRRDQSSRAAARLSFPSTAPRCRTDGT